MRYEATQQSHVTPSSVTLNYRIDGREDGDWIVLSHSLATDLRLFDHEAGYLSKSFRVLRYDTRGHGQSHATAPPYRFSELCADLVSLMDHLEIRQADILGVSLGGMTALAMGVTHPDRVRRIVCCDARADAPDAYKALWESNIDRLYVEGIVALCESMLARWFTAGFLAHPANRETVDRVRAMFTATSNDGYEGCARCLQTLDLLPSLSSLEHETLFMTGEYDMAAPVAVMQAMADASPNGSFAMIPDASHLSNLEQPERFAHTLCAFLGISGDNTNQ